MPFAVPINLSCSADSNIHIKELYVRKAVSIITLVDSPTQLNLYFGSIFDTSCYVNMYVSDLDKSLDLEKFSKRNYSWSSLSSWRSKFSCLVLLSIFKIFRKHFSFSSRFTRFLYLISLSPLDFHNFV